MDPYSVNVNWNVSYLHEINNQVNIISIIIINN